MPGLGRLSAVLGAAGTIQRSTATTLRHLLLAPLGSTALGCEPPPLGSLEATPGLIASVRSQDCFLAIFACGGLLYKAGR